jgi:surface antigen
MNKHWWGSLRAIVGFACVALSLPALSDPPDHAKAWGWRKKHDPHYVGYTGKEWQRDYGIVEGHCNRDDIGAVLGAVAGGVIGSKVGDESSRPVAILVGAVLGAAIGHEIGRDLDERDRACVGHALELVKDGQSVRWTNEITHVNYLLTPRAPSRSDGTCRQYEIKTTAGSAVRTAIGKACRKADGTWAVAS